jgi:hypothetical protein
MSSRLREMVESLLELLDDFGINEEIVSISHENIVYRESLKTERTLAVLRKAKSALAEPVLNCEVGTAEEQAKRFDVYCHTGGGLCLSIDSCAECTIAWMHMPYEEVK